MKRPKSAFNEKHWFGVLYIVNKFNRFGNANSNLIIRNFVSILWINISAKMEVVNSSILKS